jgi:hypothetical protein
MIGGKMIAKKISLENDIVDFSAYFFNRKVTYLQKIAVITPIKMAIVDSCKYFMFLSSIK